MYYIIILIESNAKKKKLLGSFVNSGCCKMVISKFSNHNSKEYLTLNDLEMY